MIKFINRTNRFKRSYKKLSTDVQNDFNDKIKIFVKNPREPKLKTHKLKGRLEECFAFDLIKGFRVLFLFDSSNTISLIDVGSHDKYKVW